jgi:Flp pilus assembly pilin Flp
MRMRMFKENEKGQAVVEYILGVALALSLVVVMGTGFRKSLYRLWSTISGEVSAACPQCPKDPRTRLR